MLNVDWHPAGPGEVSDSEAIAIQNCTNAAASARGRAPRPVNSIVWMKG